MKKISENLRNLLAVIAVILIFANFTNFKTESTHSDVPKYHITGGANQFVVYDAVTGRYKIMSLYELKQENHINDIFQRDN